MESLSFERSSRGVSRGERVGVVGVLLFVLFFGVVLSVVVRAGERASSVQGSDRVVADPEPRPGRRY